ncbi:hypothetical protein GCM10027185_06570 [Spirosoma pulveris]
MDIDIENGIGKQVQRGKSGLFLSFPQGDSRHIGITIGVTAGLKPTVKFSMMDKEYLLPVGTADPGGASDVPNKQRPIEAIGIGPDEGDSFLCHSPFPFIGRAVLLKQRKQGFSIHMLVFAQKSRNL